MATENTPPSPVITEHTLNQTDQVTEKQTKKTYVHTPEQKLYSQQPRFSTYEIIQKFPNIKSRYCQKIGFSIPWNKDAEPPNKDTYYLAIKYLFKILKEYDNTFQILPWDIRKRECNPIVDNTLIPNSHEELQEYVYDLHIHPTRVRASMVVSSTSNLTNLSKQHPKISSRDSEFIRFMQKEKLFFKTLSIQTLGEIKLVGFLQYVHPHYTNMKRLLSEIQSILETKDVVIELYRPRATDKDNKQIAAPEAIAIGAPSDISIAVYKSLVEKWKSIMGGEYDIVIGEDSVLKESFFIPFSHNLLNKKSRNKAVLDHLDFMNEYTSIQIRRCGSIDEKFKLTEEEIKQINYEFKEGIEQEITLRDIINCWTEQDSSELLVKTIQNCAGNTKTLLIKKTHKRRITNEIGRLLEILEKRSDFNIICGNSHEYGASIGKFTISKNGRNYLSSLRVRQPSSTIASNDLDKDESINLNRENRKRHLSIDTTPSKSGTSTASPIHKKGTCDNIPPLTNSVNESTTLSYSAATKGTNKQDKDKDSSSTTNESNKFTTALAVLQSSKQTKKTTDKIVRFVDTSTAEITMSTMSNDERIIVSNQQSDLTQLMEKQFNDFTSAMSQKYESTIQQMQDTHIAQMNQIIITQEKHETKLEKLQNSQIKETHIVQMKEIITKQKEYDTDIEKLQKSQMKIKENLEAKMENKIEHQTNLLTSLVSMIHEMKEEKTTTNQEHTIESSKNSVIIDSTAISQGDMTDCSYSEEEETTPSTIRKDKSLQNPTLTKDPVSPSSIEVHDGKDDSKSNSPSTTQCETHTNQIDNNDVNDIRLKTRSKRITRSKDEKLVWKGISTSTKRVTKLQHAIISPMKKKGKEKKCDKNSPTYNRYDPAGLITKKNSDEENDSDHSTETHRILRSGKRT